MRKDGKPSSGASKIVQVRIPDDMLAEITKRIQASMSYTLTEPWTISTFIRDCVRERLDKPSRAKASRERKKKERQIHVAAKQGPTAGQENTTRNSSRGYLAIPLVEVGDGCLPMPGRMDGYYPLPLV
jgi:Arc/MetJ-type ribon-helix-helix transcriptional regulator